MATAPTTPSLQTTIMNQFIEAQEERKKREQKLSVIPTRAQTGLLNRELVEQADGTTAPRQNSFMDIFSDTTDNQRSGMLMAGLSLMASDPTAKLSQRVAVAIQQGVGTMQEGREADLAADRASAQAGVDAAERESDALMDRFELYKSGKELALNTRRTVATEAGEARQAKGKTGQPFNIVFADGTSEAASFNSQTQEYIDPTGTPYSSQELAGAKVEKIGRTEFDAPLKKTQIDILDTLSGTELSAGMGLDIVLDPNLESVVGPIDPRTPGSKVENLATLVMSPEQQTLRGKLERNIIDSTFEVVRKLAPVTEEDVKLAMKKGIDPNLEAPAVRSVYLGAQMPELLNTIETKSLQSGGDGIAVRAKVIDKLTDSLFAKGRGITPEEAGVVITKWMPDASEVSGRKGFVITPSGKALPLGFATKLALSKGYSTLEEFAEDKGLRIQ